MLSLEFLAKVISPAAVLVTREQCTVARHRQSPCRRCLEVCPAGCLSLDRGPVLDAEGCEGCGLCTAACPTGALRLRERSLRGMALGKGDQANRNRTLTITCRYSEAAGTGDAGAAADAGTDTVSLPCLGWLTADHLVWLGLSRRGPIVLVGGECHSCRYARGREIVGAAIRRSRGVLHAAGRAGAKFRKGPTLHGPVQPDGSERPAGHGAARMVTRKELFSLIRVEAVQAVAAASEDLIPLRTFDPARPAYLVPQRRAAWLALARNLDWPARPVPAADLPFAPRTIAPGCNGCGACARFCPSGALRLEGGDTTHNPEICLDCGLCRSLCPKGLVGEGREVSLEGLGRGRRRTLTSHQSRRCRDCGQEYLVEMPVTVPAGAGIPTICPACEGERRLLGVG